MSVQIRKEMFAPFDPACVADIFCEGICAVTKLGDDCLRFTVFATRDRGDGEVERIVVAQLIWTKGALKIALEQTSAIINGKPFLNTCGAQTPPH